MSVKLVRVDFRLIHGQVITRWLKQCDINEIVTIDDGLSKDLFMQDVFKMAAPKGVKIKILSIEDAVKYQDEGNLDKNRVLLLYKNVNGLFESFNAGIKLEQVQIGGLGGGPGRVAVNNAITLNHSDAEKLEKMEEKGVEVFFQTTPDYPKITLAEAIRKLNR